MEYTYSEPLEQREEIPEKIIEIKNGEAIKFPSIPSIFVVLGYKFNQMGYKDQKLGVGDSVEKAKEDAKRKLDLTL